MCVVRNYRGILQGGSETCQGQGHPSCCYVLVNAINTDTVKMLLLHFFVSSDNCGNFQNLFKYKMKGKNCDLHLLWDSLLHEEVFVLAFQRQCSGMLSHSFSQNRLTVSVLKVRSQHYGLHNVSCKIDVYCLETQTGVILISFPAFT